MSRVAIYALPPSLRMRMRKQGAGVSSGQLLRTLGRVVEREVYRREQSAPEEQVSS